jgi:hypothetical protein
LPPWPRASPPGCGKLRSKKTGCIGSLRASRRA